MGNVQSTPGTELQSVGPNAITNPGPDAPLLLLASPSIDYQPWRIRGTLTVDREEQRINRIVSADSAHPDRNSFIVCYGLNSTDDSPVAQARKLARHGLEASVYRGGLFEWSLLRDAFGDTDYGIEHTAGDGDACCNTLDFLSRE